MSSSGYFLKAKALVAGVLLLVMFWTLLTAPAVAQTLPTTEAELAAIYGTKIREFWDTQGRRQDFKGVDGFNIATMSFRRAGSAKGIVIANGMTDTFLYYKEVVYDFWRAGYSVYVLDHRGQGLSQRLLGSVSEYSKKRRDRDQQYYNEMVYVREFEDYIKDLNTFINAIVKPDGNENLFLVGHSMGGAIASRYLEKHPDDFDAAVMTAPMHEPNLNPVPRYLCWSFRLFGSATEYVWGRGPYVEPKQFNPNFALTSSKVRDELLVRNEVRMTPSARMGGPSFKWVYEACKASNQSRYNASKIKVPVLIFQATIDEVVNARGQNEFCRKMNSSISGSCRIERVDGARHNLMREIDTFRTPVLTKTLTFFSTHSE